MLAEIENGKKVNLAQSLMLAHTCTRTHAHALPHSQSHTHTHTHSHEHTQAFSPAYFRTNKHQLFYLQTFQILSREEASDGKSLHQDNWNLASRAFRL